MSPPHVLIKTVDNGAGVFLEHGPAVPVLLVCLHKDAVKEHHTPISTAAQSWFELGAGPLIETGMAAELSYCLVHP